MYRTNAPPPTPQRARFPTAIIVISLVVALLAFIAAVGAIAAVFVFRRSPSAATDVPSSPSAAGTSTSVHVPPGNSPVATEGLAPGEDVEVAGTPAASLRARPSWGQREQLTIHAKPGSQYAPQASNAAEAFQLARPLSGDVTQAFVICRIQTFAKHDAFAGDDLHARVTFGQALEMANDGPENGNLAFVSAPHVSVKRGARIGIQVFDRDVFGLTSLATVSHALDGGPVVLLETNAAIECRGLDGDALRQATQSKAAAATSALSELVRARVDTTKSDWGMASSAKVETPIADVAALAGWDDPRVVARVATYAKESTRLANERTAAFDRLRGTARASGKMGAFEVTVERTDCGGTCAVLTVKNTSRAPADFSDMFVTAYVATREAGPRPAIVGAEDRASAIAPGESATRQVSLLGAGHVAGALLGLCDHPAFRLSEGACTVFAVP